MRAGCQSRKVEEMDSGLAWQSLSIPWFGPCPGHGPLSKPNLDLCHKIRFLEVEFFSDIPKFIQTCHEGSWCTFRSSAYIRVIAREVETCINLNLTNFVIRFDLFEADFFLL